LKPLWQSNKFTEPQKKKENKNKINKLTYFSRFLRLRNYSGQIGFLLIFSTFTWLFCLLFWPLLCTTKRTGEKQSAQREMRMANDAALGTKQKIGGRAALPTSAATSTAAQQVASPIKDKIRKQERKQI